MGTIASVLQWSCTNCNAINPTESPKCIKCGTTRKVFYNVLALGNTNNCDTCTRTITEKGVFNETELENLSILKKRNDSNRVYTSLLRGCLKRPQRNQHNLPVNCIDCEDTRKYVKSSIELYHHFSNPSLNRRWFCIECESENNSVTWHCVICDTVSYLAPIYKDSFNENLHKTHKYTQRNKNEISNIRHINKKTSYDISDAYVNKLGRQFKNKSFLRRTQSLTDVNSLSCRSCHICFVNNRKHIFNLPTELMNNSNKETKADIKNGQSILLENNGTMDVSKINQGSNYICSNHKSCSIINKKFTISTLLRRSDSKFPSAKPVVRSNGVFIAVNDWSQDNKHICSPNGTVKYNETLINKSPIIDKDMYTDFCHIYENNTIVKRAAIQNDISVNKSTLLSNEPVYAIVLKNNKPKEKTSHDCSLQTLESQTINNTDGNMTLTTTFSKSIDLVNAKSLNCEQSMSLTYADIKYDVNIEHSIYAKVWKGPKKYSESNISNNSKNTESSSTYNSKRMWTCIRCSYAYNRIWSKKCEICETIRSQPSLTQPSLITVTKSPDVNSPSIELKQYPGYTSPSSL